MKKSNVLRYISDFFNLSISLAKAEFKLRNEGSYLGILWYLLNPLLMFAVLLVIFSYNLGVNIPHYPAYLLLGIIMFNFFQQVTNASIINIRDNRLIIKSVKFTRESLVGSTLFRNIFSHIFEIILFIIIALILGVNIKGMIFYIPIFFFFCMFIFGCSLIIGSFYIYFADMEFIWQFFSRLVFFATPIFYSATGMKWTFILNLFNPLYYFITIARDIIIYNKTPDNFLIIGAVLFSVTFFVLGLAIFHKLKVKFAELL